MKRLIVFSSIAVVLCFMVLGSTTRKISCEDVRYNDTVCKYHHITDIDQLNDKIGESGFYLDFSYTDTSISGGRTDIIVVPVKKLLPDCFLEDSTLLETYKYLGGYAFEHRKFSCASDTVVQACDTLFPIDFYEIVDEFTND